MKLKYVLLIFFLFSFLKGKEIDLSMNTYNEINSVSMLYNNLSFIINTTAASIAFLILLIEVQIFIYQKI